jgi:hypothetical protein
MDDLPYPENLYDIRPCTTRFKIDVVAGGQAYTIPIDTKVLLTRPSMFRVLILRSHTKDTFMRTIPGRVFAVEN